MGLTRRRNTKAKPEASTASSDLATGREYGDFSTESADSEHPLYTLLIGVFMIATHLIKRLTLVTVTAIIFTRHRPVISYHISLCQSVTLFHVYYPHLIRELTQRRVEVKR